MFPHEPFVILLFDIKPIAQFLSPRGEIGKVPIVLAFATPCIFVIYSVFFLTLQI